MPQIDIVLSPSLWPLQDAKDKNIVVIDIFRATSTIAAALNAGAQYILPLKESKETLAYQKKGYLTAGERNGKPIEGFDFGNSPVLIQDEKLIHKPLALTTTNGTKCFDLAQKAKAHAIYSGSFLNISALCKQLAKDNKDVILFCAGWKNHVNLEDTLFAGAVYEKLKSNFQAVQDAVLIASSIYQSANKVGFTNYLKNSSHYQRLKAFGADRDMEFALEQDQYDFLVLLEKGLLVKINPTAQA